MTPHALPKASGGVGPYTYALDCGATTLADLGLSLTPSSAVGSNVTPKLSGTPTKAGKFSCAFSVTDSATPTAGTYEINVDLTINGPSGLTLGSFTAVPSLTVGTAMTPHALPKASGGVGPYTYALDCGATALDDLGLSLTPSSAVGSNVTPKLSGTPTKAGKFSCAFSVTDSATPTAGTYEVNVDLTIEGRSGLTLTGAVPTLTGLTVGTSMTQADLPKASGGVGPYTYALDCGAATLDDLGLSLTPSGAVGSNVTPKLAGTPTKAGKFPCAFSVTDSATPTAGTYEINVDLTINGPSGLTLGSFTAVPSLTVGTAMTPHALPKASGGVGPYTYALDCGATTLADLGLSLTPSSAVGSNVTPKLSGTPTKAGKFSCAFSVTDSATPTAGTYEINVDLTINGPSGLTLGSFTAVPSLTVGTAMTPHALPKASGGVGPYTYALDCGATALDDLGLSLTPSSAVGSNVTPKLSGTPTKAGKFSCAFSVTDSATPTAGTYEINVDLTIQAAAQLEASGSVTTPSGWVVRKRITPWELPSFSGGVPPYTHTVDCGAQSLKGLGLQILPATTLLAEQTPRVIGTPTKVGAYQCLYTVTDSAEDRPARAHLFLDFSIARPAGDTTLRFGWYDWEQDFTAGVPLSLSLPGAAGGTAPYTYSLVPASCLDGQRSFLYKTTTKDGTTTREPIVDKDGKPVLSPPVEPPLEPRNARHQRDCTCRRHEPIYCRCLRVHG